MSKKSQLPKPLMNIQGYKLLSIKGRIHIYTGKKVYDDNGGRGYKDVETAKLLIECLFEQKKDQKTIDDAKNPYLSSLSSARKRIQKLETVKKNLKKL